MSIITDRASATKTEATLGAPVILGSNAGAGPGVAGENTGTGPGLLACGVTAPASRVVLETASLNAVQVVAEIVKLTTGATAAGDGHGRHDSIGLVGECPHPVAWRPVPSGPCSRRRSELAGPRWSGAGSPRDTQVTGSTRCTTPRPSGTRWSTSFCSTR